ncbi:MAG: hypothetical protein V4489_03020 [Chlamydiota bacterium]
MLGKFLDPKNDVAFKRIFGSENNREELLAYERAEKAKNDYLSSLDQKFGEGKAEERAKAELEKAEMEVKFEQEKALTLKHMARNLKEQGVPISVIHLTTRLSVKEIEDL